MSNYTLTVGILQAAFRGLDPKAKVKVSLLGLELKYIKTTEDYLRRELILCTGSDGELTIEVI